MSFSSVARFGFIAGPRSQPARSNLTCPFPPMHIPSPLGHSPPYPFHLRLLVADASLSLNRCCIAGHHSRQRTNVRKKESGKYLGSIPSFLVFLLDVRVLGRSVPGIPVSSHVLGHLFRFQLFVSIAGRHEKWRVSAGPVGIFTSLSKINCSRHRS